jgi:hypothetical protein
MLLYPIWFTRWRSWLRHCATSWKVTGSIPDGVVGIFNLHNSSCRTMALGLTQPLTEMSTRNISWEKRWPVRRADNVTTFICRLSCSLGASNSWNPRDFSRPLMGLLLRIYTTTVERTGKCSILFLTFMAPMLSCSHVCRILIMQQWDSVSTSSRLTFWSLNLMTVFYCRIYVGYDSYLSDTMRAYGP